MKVKIDFDLVEILGISFACHEKIYRDIDQLYKENPGHYNYLAMQSEYMDTYLMNNLSLTEKLYYIKAIGVILAHSMDDGIEDARFDTQVMAVAKKGWKKLYKYIFNTSAAIRMSDIDRCLMNEMAHEDKAEMIRFLMTVFFCISLNKGFDTSDERTQMYFGFYHQLKESDFTQQFQLEQYDQNFKDAVKKYGDLVKRKLSFEDIVEDLNEKTNRINRELSCVPFTMGNLSPSTIYYENALSQKDVEQLIIGYLLITKELEPDEDQFLKYMAYVRMTGAMCHAYEKYSKIIMAKQQELAAQYKQQENLKQQLNEMIQENSAKDRQIETLKQQIALLRADVAQGDNAYRKLQLQLDQNEEAHQELQALRELMFSIEKEEAPIEDEAAIYRTEDSNGIIIGGHQRFTAKLKPYAPHYKYIAVDQLNFDTDLITEESILFFVTGYLSHALYYKCMQAARACGAKAAFIDQTNIGLAMQQIQRVISDQAH